MAVVKNYTTVNRMKRVGVDLGFKTKNYGDISSRRHSSAYSEQLCMKQTIRFYYGVLEKQFQNYYAKAEKQKDLPVIIYCYF